MEDELDPRYYIGVVAKYWKWLLGLFAVAVLVAGLLSSLVLSPVYETAATVWVDEAVIAGRAGTGDESSMLSEAEHVAVLRQIIASLGGVLPEELRSTKALDPLLSASTVDERSVVRLQVRHKAPVLARDIANTWATVVVDMARMRYAALAGDAAALEQLEAAEADMWATEQALVDFKEAKSTEAMAAVIDAQQQALADYERARASVELALHDVSSLKQQLQASDSESPSLASALSILLIQVNTLGASSNLGEQIQIGVEASSLEGVTIPEQIAQLDGLMTALVAKRQALAAASEELLREVLGAQGELQEAKVEWEELRTARDEARQAYQELSNKVARAPDPSKPEQEVAQVASLAELPQRPVVPKTGVNMAIAGVLATITGFFGAFVVEYLRKPSQTTCEG